MAPFEAAIAVHFVNSHPFSISKREQELIRSDARAHSAIVSHPKNRKNFAYPLDEKPHSRGQTTVLDLSFGQNEVQSSTPTCDAQLLNPKTSQTATKVRRRINQIGQGLHTYKFKALIFDGTATRGIKAGHDRRRYKRHHGTPEEPPTKNSIPLYQGNIDPFNTTVIPISALEHVLLQQSRSHCAQITWPSEIALRHNHTALTMESFKFKSLANTGKASSHAIMAHAYYNHANLQRAQGQSHENSLLLGEKHKLQALRSLQELIEAHRTSGDPQQLHQIYDACTNLSDAEMHSGQFQAAIVHVTASRNIIDAMGGLFVVDNMRKEMFLGPVVNLAAFLRARPAIATDEFDPGPWSSFQSNLELKDAPPLYDELVFMSSQTHGTLMSKPTRVTKRQRTIFADIKELLAVEDLKFKYATSQALVIQDIFRWSYARKLTVRARALHYWSDVNELVKCQTTSTSIKSGHLNTNIPSASLGTPSFEFALCLTMHTFDRWIFEEYYLPAGVSCDCKHYYAELVALMAAIRPATEDVSFVSDDDAYDVLWIYFVGAYLEDVYLNPEQLQGSGRMPHYEKYFTTRFGYMVATNLEFCSFEYVKALLQENYLYYARLQDATLRKLLNLEAKTA